MSCVQHGVRQSQNCNSRLWSGDIRVAIPVPAFCQEVLYMDQEQLLQASEHYRDQYEVAAKYSFVAGGKQFVTDHATAKHRRCRFCHRGRPEVSFSAEAHAIPAFLGNHSVFSNNECNACNKFLADNYEDHLGKWSNYGRSLVGVQGRKLPTHKTPDGARIDRNETGAHIHLPTSDPELFTDLKAKDGPFEFTPPIDGESQPYVPLRAAMALIKVACSICPSSDLDQCGLAIDWLMERKQASIVPFPVLFQFTPGVVAEADSEVLLFRRLSDEAIPYFWLVLQYKNFCLQTFVPFCPKDSHWLRENTEATFTLTHYPSKFGTQWPFGPTTYGRLDWSSPKSEQSTSRATFQFIGQVQDRPETP